MKKLLFFLLTLAVLLPWAANAQQSLPYSYGFENNNLATDGWTSTGGAISSSAAYNSSSYGYRFSYSVSSDVFLMSPILTGGTSGVNVSFYYKAYSGSYLDHFYVGYTTDRTVTDPSAFTYGAMVTSSTTWQLYEETLPAGTVRVAIKYDEDNYDDGYYLYLDDFTFEAASSCIKPGDITLSSSNGTSATISWTAGGTETSWNVYLSQGGSPVAGYNPLVVNTNPTCSFNGLTASTTYDVAIEAICGGDVSNQRTTSFSTACGAVTIPYTYGFEDATPFACWSTFNCEEDDNNYISGVVSSSTYANNGDGFFAFSSYNGTVDPPQYVISPELTGIANGLHVEFYYRSVADDYNETFQVGYSTTDNAVGSFTWGSEITSSSATYTHFAANYPAATKYIAVRYTSDYLYYLMLDDFTFEEAPSCLEPTGISASDITTTGANINWTNGATETTWDIYVTTSSTDVPDGTTTPTVANATIKPYPLTGLNSGTAYYVYMRSVCSSTESSAWSIKGVFHTECVAENLPYSYGFEDASLPVCWNVINDNPSYNIVTVKNTNANNGSYNLDLRRGSPDGTQIVVLPEMDNALALNGYQISFYTEYYTESSNYGSSLAIGIMTDPTDESTFVQVGDAISPTTTYDQYTVLLDSYTGSGHYIAIKHTSTAYGNTYVDDIEVTAIPTCMKPTNLNVEGGLSAVVTWDGSASSYDIAYSQSSTANPADVIIATGYAGNSYDLSGVVNIGDNYVWVRANCGSDGYSNWADAYYNANYCTPNPTSHDGSGITAVSFGTGSYVVSNGDASASLPATSPYYGDYTSMIGAVQAGVESTIAITTATGSYPYTFVIWVDLDNDLEFEDSEILYIGKAASGNGTLNATITIPATQALGDYRMRIYGADSYFNSFYGSGTTNWTAAHDPCASGTYRHAHDYTVRVLEAPSCLAASNVGVASEDITSTTAIIRWTNNNGNAATYTVKQDETVLTTTAVDSYTLTTLVPGTTYIAGTFTVISNCDESLIVNVPAFTTECEAFTITRTVSYTQDFEDPVVTSTYSSSTGLEVPNCWDNPYTTSSNAAGNPHLVSASDYYNYASSGQVLLFYGSGSNYVTLPEFTNNLNTLQIGFKWATESSSTGTLALGYITAQDVNYNTFTVIKTYAASSASQHTLNADMVMLDTLPTTATRLAFRWFCNGQYSCNIDDIEVSLLPSCMKPTGVHITELTAHGVTIEWDPVEGAWYQSNAVLKTLADNYVDPDEYFTAAGNRLDNSASWDRLQPETEYVFALRRVCSSDDKSEVVFLPFTTLDACLIPTLQPASDITAASATLNWTGLQDNYNVRYREVITPEIILNETYDFEDGTLQGWTSYDEDGDGNGWTNASSSSTAHGGSRYMSSRYNSSAVPNDWLISPEIPLGGTLSFYAKKSSGTEQFQVYVSTTGTDISNFTAISDVIDATTDWGLYEYNLSDYTGNGHVAIKHTGAVDQYWFYVDDITITKVTPGVYGEWNETNTNVTSPLPISGLQPSTSYEWQVQGISSECSGGLTEWSEIAEFETGAFTAYFFEGTGDCDVVSLTGSSIALPTATISCDGWSFAGWATAPVNEIAADPTLLLSSTYTPAADTKLYAIYSNTATGKYNSFPACVRTQLDVTEGFETYAVGVTPDANGRTFVKPTGWTVVTQYEPMAVSKRGRPQVFQAANVAHNSSYSLLVDSLSLLAMPKLDDAIVVSDLQMELYVRQSKNCHALEIGVMSDLTNPSSFVHIGIINNEGVGVNYRKVDFSSYNDDLGGRYIVFRNFYSSPDEGLKSFNYLDDILLSTPEESNCGIASLPYVNGFDSDGEMGELSCWTVANKDYNYADTYAPQVSHTATYAQSGSNSLLLDGRCLYAMPELKAVDIDNMTVSVLDLQMQFFVNQPDENRLLQVGVMSDLNNPASFKVLQTVSNNGETGPKMHVLDFSDLAATHPDVADWTAYKYIAFRNIYDGSWGRSPQYIDDIKLNLAGTNLCSITVPYENGFDSTEDADELSCWTLVKKDYNFANSYAPQISNTAAYAHSGSNSLLLDGRCIYAMPELAGSEAIQDLQLEFYVRQYSSNCKLQVGVMTDVNNANSFVLVAEISNGGIKGTQFHKVLFSGYEGSGRFIAFRNTYDGSWGRSPNYLDDITLDIATDNGCGISSLPYENNFDGETAGQEPSCWTLAKKDYNFTDNYAPLVMQGAYYAHSGENSLMLDGRCIYAMPEFKVDGKNIADIQLDFYVRQYSAACSLQVGIMSDVNNPNSFVALATVSNDGAAGQHLHTVDFRTLDVPAGAKFIAFRNIYDGTWGRSPQYIDDITIYIPETRNESAHNSGFNADGDSDYTNDLEEVTAPLGVDEFNFSDFNVWPNPTTGLLTLGTEAQRVEISSLMGQRVAVFENTSSIDISDLPSGVYILKATLPQGEAVRKVVKR